ncbi:MAG TPA: SDR family oxidoreductase [Candidatus Limnocylindrales bacterium]|jgi:3-oxoacyl-[acyl-carrier protein] reductase|nr:SDR family oxidoreductase [Candidatus Limnocylindrales bacterium]
METGLKGKVVLITGASGGIGSGIARAFAAEGARLVLHYRSGRARLTHLQADLAGTESLALRADLTREAEARQMFARAVNHFGRIDTLIANAGAWEVRNVPLHKMSLQQWRHTMDGVLTTTFLSVREFFRVVEKQKRGNAVLIASTAAVFGEAGHADYAGAKSALAYGLTRSLKNELARLAPHTDDYCGGRINCICPGWTVVPRLAQKLGDKQVIRKVTATMALPQLARPGDIAQAAVFLSSDNLTRHITGLTLVIAGGMEGRLLWAADEIDPDIV